ncbi:hypothetical protein [Brenneria izadpanahii]|uniref:hypothetical protein n=1 Tax=Brenneria izadpanahii TaxID=2722756 RepID=UPI001AAFAF1C|nr:hypothetical protein [Brenneria izadpanahii]
MIGSLIEQQFLSARNWPFGAALAMLLMSMVLFALLLYLYLSSRYSHAGTNRSNDEK